MSALTREEIRAACEAVEWEWEGCCSAWDPESLRHGLFHGSFHSEGEGGPPYIWNPSHPSHVDADAIALLGAWKSLSKRHDVEILLGERVRLLQHHPVIPTSEWSYSTGDLPADAVRAVNAWAESRKESR